MNKKKISIKQDTIEFFEETCNEVLSKIFNKNPENVLVTDLSTVLDFSYTQEELDRDLEKIKNIYEIDLREVGDYKLTTLCRLIEINKETSNRIH